MNKREFMEYLEKRLSILKEKERRDIISEYSQHIDMKTGQGMTEIEAIKAFGDPKEFVDEILEAYNVDPEYEEELIHSDSSINRVTGGIRKASEFVFSQSPVTLIKMLAKLLIVFSILFIIISMGFMLIGEVFINQLDMELIGAALLFAYLAVTVPIAFYVIYIYTKKLALSVSGKCGSGLLADIGRGVNAFADFMITQKPSALIVFAFKLFVMGSVLFVAGMVGMIVPAVIGGILDNFANLHQIVFALYLVIAVPVGLYILWCYGERLVKDMNERVKGKGRGAQSEVESALHSGNEPKTIESEAAKQDDKEVACANRERGDELFAFFGRGVRTMLHFLWRAAVLLFKAAVALTLCAAAAMLAPVAFLTGAALVALVMGYPAAGIFLMLFGGCVSGAACIMLVIKVVFRRNVYEKSA